MFDFNDFKFKSLVFRLTVCSGGQEAKYRRKREMKTQIHTKTPSHAEFTTHNENVDNGFVNIINSGFLVSKRKLWCCVGGRNED